MNDYSVNKISNDVCEFVLVIENDVVYGFLERLGLNDLRDELINEHKSINKLLDDHVEFKMIFSKIMGMQAEAISPYTFCDDAYPIVKIIEENDKNFTAVITQLILDDDFKLKYPSMNEIKYEQEILDESSLNSTIEDILFNNGFFETIEVNEGYLDECEVYLNIKGKDVHIKDILDEEEYYEAIIENKKDEKSKVGDTIKVKNKLLKNSKIVYTISSLLDYVPVELTDEIASKLNYNKTKTAVEFKKEVRKNLNNIDSLYNIVNAIKGRMVEMNDVHISSYCTELYSILLKIVCNESLSLEQLNDYAKTRRIMQYIDRDMNKMDNLDTYFLEEIIKKQYKLDKLAGHKVEETYEEYLKKYINDLKLYAYVKKQ